MWAAAVQSAGTVFFNVTTFRALDTALSNPDYDALVWRPDALGSVCFLVSGVIAYAAARRHGWQPLVNLLGCVFFGIAAVAGYVVPASGSMLDLAWANWNTSLGAACFLACAVSGLATHEASPTTPLIVRYSPSAPNSTTMRRSWLRRAQAVSRSRNAVAVAGDRNTSTSAPSGIANHSAL